MNHSFAAGEFSDHADFYQRGPYARYLTDRKIVGRQPVAMFAADQPAGHFPDPPMPTVLLYLARKGATNACFDWGAGRWRGRWRRDDLTIVPPGAASDVSLSERHSFLGLCLPVAMFGDDEDTTGQRAIETLGKLYCAPFRDRLAAELCNTLWLEGGAEGTGCELFADNALQCLVGRLRYLATKSNHRTTRSMLSRSALSRVEDFIRAELNNPIKVADLAAVAGHSQSHFSALFKRTTGQTPYNYVLVLRIERAEELIAAHPKRALADIALASGFSSQSHMTSAFRQFTGTTPGRRS